MLAAHGLRGVAVDLRGHGLSDRPEAGVYGAAALVRHVEALLDALGVARAVLVGQSMSGGVVLDALRTVPHRLRGAVLLAPIGLVPIRRITVARLVRAERWLPERVPRVVITLLMRRVYGVRGTWGGRDVDEYWWPLRTPRSMAALMALVNEFDWVPRDPWEASAGAPPVRVLLGERDKLIACAPAAARARQLPRTQVTVIPGAGHLLAEEVAEEVASAIVAVASPAPTPRAGA
jgi:pimeloyl-ACP methyl ester carboxylesterase